MVWPSQNKRPQAGLVGTYVTEKQGNPNRGKTAEFCVGLGFMADKLHSLSLKL